MAMTRREQLGKLQVMRKLAKEGYKTYSEIFELFDFNITNDPKVIAYMEPGKGRIVVNGGLSISAISVVVRHEILHEYFKHEDRLVRHVAKKLNLNPNDLDDLSIRRIKNLIYSNKIFNIAGDYEISNFGYTDEDKVSIRNLSLNGEVLSGLVTEIDHPEMIDWPLEKMYDALINDENFTEPDYDELNKQLENGDFSQIDPDGDGSGNGMPIDPDKLSDKAKKNLEDYLKEKNKDKKPEVGDKGDKETQDKEEEERKKKDVTGSGDGEEDKDGDKKSKGSGSGKDKKDKDGEKGDAGDEGSGGSGDTDDGDTPGKGGNGPGNGSPDGAEGEIKKKLSKAEKIRDMMNNPDIARKLKREVAKNIEASDREKARRELERYHASGIYNFELELNDFLRNEVLNYKKGPTRKVPSKRTHGFPGALLPGRAKIKNEVPLINIYFDRSGSWDDSKIAVGEQAMGLIDDLKNQGLLDAEVYYFADKVVQDKDDKTLGGGTAGTPIMEHIKAMEPDNVIIMTDSDIGDIRGDITWVPGAVWLLFKGGRSQNLIDHIRGEMGTSILDI